MQNKAGRIVSKAKHMTAKREKRLVKAGFLTKKGQFGFIKNGKSMKKGRKMSGGTGNFATKSFSNASPIGRAEMSSGGRRGRRSRKMRGGFDHQTPCSDGACGAGGGRKMRGGMAYGGPLSPLAYDGRGEGLRGDSVAVQFAAGMGN
jgi:hypothetical protein